MQKDEEHVISQNIVRFLRPHGKEGQEFEVAINPELRRVLVFADDELMLSCSFDELISGPGVSPN